MGIEYNRIVNPSAVNFDIMTCPNCKLLINNPCMCGICKTHFCYDCLSDYMKK